MGTYNHELLGTNGDSGHAYSLRKNVEPFSMEDLNSVRFYAVWRGHVAIDGSLSPTTKGNVGSIELRPPLTSDEIHEIEEAGFRVGTDPVHEHDF